MPDKIDYTFLSELEGGNKTKGYEPAASVSRSGVTIAIGFDLGQRHERDLQSLQLDPQLVSKLKPYLGIKGAAAQSLIKRSPLTITPFHAQSINKAVKASHINQLKMKYDAAAGSNKKFFDLPTEAQTVIASVSFQYGVGLNARTPKFWKAITANDWPETVNILKSFGDAYPSRRLKEASFLERIK